MGVLNVCCYFVIDCLFHLNFDVNMYYLCGKNDSDTGVAHEAHHVPVVTPFMFSL